jgi:IS1 family transposase
VRHIVSKSETCLVESFNARLRHYIASLKRRNMCYAKSRKTLEFDIFLLANRKKIRKYL